MEVQWSSLNPPQPNNLKSSKSKAQKEITEFKAIFQLLTLIKSKSKQQNDTNSEAKGDHHGSIEKILDAFSSLRDVYLRHGFLEGDVDRAQGLLEKLKTQDTDPKATNGGGGKKRNRRSFKTTSGVKTLLQSLQGRKEASILSSLFQVLIPSSGGSFYAPVIVRAAADVMFTICHSCSNSLSRNNESPVSDVEYRIIEQVGPEVIGGLSKVIEELMSNMKGHDTSEAKLGMNDIHLALDSCCKAATSIIIILQLRLSRRTNVMKSVEVAAESILWYDGECSTQTLEAAARLLATIPLAGDPSGNSDADLWTEKLQKNSSNIMMTLNLSYPLKSKREMRTYGEKNQSESSKWVQDLRSYGQAERIIMFHHRIKGHVLLLKSLFEMDGYTQKAVKVPFTCLLDMIESMLKFQSIAETRYLSTKSSLRDVSVEGGVLSPNAAVMIANTIKHYGHVLLQGCLAVVKASCLSYGNRLIRIVLSSLKSSCSNVLCRVVDPSFSSSFMAGDKSNRKWLHAAVCLRENAIRSFVCVIQYLGSNAAVSCRESVLEGVTFVTGCLLEQISNGHSENRIEYEHWGTDGECAKLVKTCSESIATCLTVFGGFLEMECRELIDSTAITCLSTIQRINLLLSSETKASFLNLGIVCVSTPWPDGAGPSDWITSLLREAALSLKFDRDLAVSRCAYTALAVCNNAATQRSPPLVIVKRNENLAHNNRGSNSFFSGKDLLNSIKSTTRDIYKTETAKKRMAADIVSDEEESSPQRAKLQKSNDKVKDDDQEQDVATNITSSERKAPDLTKEIKSVDDGHDPEGVCEADPETKQHEIIQGDGDDMEEEKEEEKESVFEQSPTDDAKSVETNDKQEESDSDDGSFDLPMIVDSGPDEEDA